MHASILFAAASLLSLVNAHGSVHTITGGAEVATSPPIGSSSADGPIWLVNTNGPVTDTSSSDMLCGSVGSKSTSSLSVAAGVTLEYSWWPGYANENNAWPHNTGPISFYMAECDGDCNNAGGQTKFYALQRYGIESNGQWKQADLHAGQSIAFNVPKNLKSGNYLIRAEIINLAISPAEVYPSCATVKITGSGTESLSGQSATFPGAYDDSAPGLSIAGSAVYNSNNANYVFPGPSLSPLGQGPSGASSGSSGSSGSSSGSQSSTSATAPSTPTVLAGAGSDPATATGSASSSIVTDTSSSSDNSTGTTGTSPTGTSPTGTTAPASSTGSSSSSGSVDSCAAAWTACNAAYTGSADDQASYHCQTDYTSCVAKAMSSNLTARRMHRRRHSLFASH